MSFTTHTIPKEYERVYKRLPQIFDSILAKLISGHDLQEKDIVSLKRDALFTLLVAIMIEEGFQIKVSESKPFEEKFEINVEYIHKWKLLSGVYEVDFNMFAFNQIMVKMLLVPLGATVLVTVVMHEMNSEAYSICLPVTRYVVLKENVKFVVNMFNNLQELSDIFKTKIVSPVKSKLLCFCGYPGASLLGIPEDVFLKIMLYLPISDIISVCKTCKKFNELLNNDDNFWHKLFIRDFNLPNASVESNWRTMYQKYYINMNHTYSIISRELSAPLLLYRYEIT